MQIVFYEAKLRFDTREDSPEFIKEWWHWKPVFFLYFFLRSRRRRGEANREQFFIGKLSNRTRLRKN